MEILYFHQHFSTPKGAAGTRSYEMARRLLYRGHRVIMVCGSYAAGKTGLDGPFVKGQREGIVDGIRVIEFNLSYSNDDGLVKRAWTFFRFAVGSISLAMHERYDLVFATTTPLTAGIPAIFARWARSKTFVFEVRDLWPELPRAMGVIRNPVVLSLMSALEWVCYRSAHRCIALSPGIADGIARRGVSRERIAMVSNGCDNQIFGAGNAEPWRPTGVTLGDLMAIYTGTHGQANGLDAVLDAASELCSRGRTDIKLVLVGEGKLKPALMARARTKSLGNVIFHDSVDKLRLAGLMAASDLGLQCLANVPAFYYGTSPNKFFDYIAAGTPVLNNYPGWIADIITEHDCGFAVPPDSAAAFADALEIAADNRSLLKRKGEQAYKLSRSHFARHLLADQWVAWVTEGRRG